MGHQLLNFVQPKQIADLVLTHVNRLLLRHNLIRRRKGHDLWLLLMIRHLLSLCWLQGPIHPLLHLKLVVRIRLPILMGDSLLLGLAITVRVVVEVARVVRADEETHKLLLDIFLTMSGLELHAC